MNTRTFSDLTQGIQSQVYIMMSYLISVLCIYFTVVTVDVSTTDFLPEGHYWRDYTGEIPKDALPAGINSQGKVTYIGQVLHAELLIPAEISPADKKVTYEWGYQEFLATQNIKILCTQEPERFEWIRTGNGLIQNVQNKLVLGGYEAGATIYIGRKYLTDELSIGKIVSTSIQTTLNTIKDGKVTQHAEFDILTYNPDINAKQNKNDQSNTTIAIDVRSGKISSETIETKCPKRKIIINFYN